MRILCLVVLLITGCALQYPDLKTVDKVTYCYSDSSVPPQYHRSYTITITEENAKVVVDSYGDILNDTNIDIEGFQFDEVLDLIRENQIATGRKREDNGCSGGTAETITLFEKEKEIFSGFVYHCQGDWGDLYGNTENVAKKLKSIFPDFHSLLK